MSWLLDTNVLSEAVRKAPSKKVLQWLISKDNSGLFVSVISISEIQRGIDRLPESKQKETYAKFLTGILEHYQNNIIAVDVHIAQEWGHIFSKTESIGRKMSVTDCYIAATASVHGLTLATRNIKDFEVAGIDLFNPWD